LYGTPISIAEISSTFDGLRYPATCPATPQSFGVAVNSYGDPTVHTVGAPLSVTGCSSVAYAPQFSVTAVRDSADKQVQLTTQITQKATEAPSRSVSLAFPTAVLAPNLASVKNLCPTLSSSCTAVGSATATSPLYPKPLTGQAYLTGSFTGLSLTLVFPSPFPLTLVGTVDLGSNATAFTGLPDIPLTDLAVTLDSGANGLFEATCVTPSGTASAGLSDQNGDKSATVPANFTVSGCPSGSGAGSSTGGGGAGAPTVTRAGVSGLRSGHASLRFKLTVARRAARLTGLTVELPSGLRFIAHRAGRRLRIRGVRLAGAAVKSLRLSHGQLVITLRKPVSAVTVTITSTALSESRALRAKARAGKLRSVRLTVITTNTRAKRTTIHIRIAPSGI